MQKPEKASKASSASRRDLFDYSSWLHRRAEEVFRDDTLWALNKPAGVLSHPNTAQKKAANALLIAPYDAQRELFRLRRSGERERQVFLLHRLDLETSGLILCAFRAEAAAALREALYRREVGKEYRALLVGAPERDEGEWSDCLEKISRQGRVEVRVRPRGRPNATTLYRVVKRFPRSGLTLVSLKPRSGRTHQLRVQAASRRTPIAGDDRYGNFTANRFLAEKVDLKRMFLHAGRLELRHPTRGHVLKLTCDFERRLAAPLERVVDLDVRVPRRPS